MLGVGLSVLNLDTAVATLRDALAAGRRGYVTVTGVHGVIESQDDEALRRIHNASLLTTPDGMPMVWMGRLAGHQTMSRVYGPDLMEAVFAWTQHSGHALLLRRQHGRGGGTQGEAGAAVSGY